MANVELTSDEEDLSSEFFESLQDDDETNEESEYVVMAPSAESEPNCMLTSFEASLLDVTLTLMEQQFHCVLHQADTFQTQLFCDSLYCSQNNIVTMVSTFLKKCQPYFTQFESTARNTSVGTSPLSTYTRTKMLQFSQQLCNRLEQLVLKCSSFGYLSLEETDPLGISHFYIGQCHVDNVKVSIFRYVLPCPFLASTNRGLYKRMRWNVEWQRESESDDEDDTYRTERAEMIEGGEQEQREKLMEGQGSYSTEYYFLCCEDVRVVEQNVGEEENKAKEKGIQNWSIGQWIHTYPDPSSQDIDNWVLCLVPQGEYMQLVSLGKEAPSTCIATDCLLGILLTPGKPAVIDTTDPTVNNDY